MPPPFAMHRYTGRVQESVTTTISEREPMRTTGPQVP